MIHITDRSKCCGCTACVNVCPVQCIVMRRDREEGFDYPVANPDLCIGCGKCEAVCPVQNPLPVRQPESAYAVRCKMHVGDSSSGGVFPALAELVIDEGGVVFGVVMESDHIVCHVEAESMDEVARMMGSKYVQSDLYSCYFDAQEYLKAGRKVLFSGTPCQIAGLKKYLGCEYDNLLTVDTACHGVPGPGLWEMYIKAIQDRAKTNFVRVDFRNKQRSWRHYDVVCTGAEAQNSTRVRAVDDPYMALFMQDMTLRPSCYNCPSRKGKSGSDVTLADLWSVAKTVPVLDDDKGTSGVLVNTAKGREYISRIKAEAIQEVPVEAVMADNGGFAEVVPMPEKREEFFIGLGVANVDVYKHLKKYVVRKPLPVRIYRAIRAGLSSIKRRIRK